MLEDEPLPDINELLGVSSDNDDPNLNDEPKFEEGFDLGGPTDSEDEFDFGDGIENLMLDEDLNEIDFDVNSELDKSVAPANIDQELDEFLKDFDDDFFDDDSDQEDGGFEWEEVDDNDDPLEGFNQTDNQGLPVLSDDDFSDLDDENLSSVFNEPFTKKKPPEELEEEVSPVEKPTEDEVDTPGFFDRIKAKIAAIKSEAANEIGDGAKKKEPSKNLVPIDEEQEDENDELDADEEAEEPEEEPSLIKKIFSPIIKIYGKLVDFIFALLTSVLGALGVIPLVGIPFRILKELIKPLRVIAGLLPPFIIAAILIFISIKAVPSSTNIKLPDMGAATFTSFEYNEKTNTATGVIKNGGDVIAEVIPTFYIYSRKMSINPIRLIVPQKVLTCKGEFIRVDIDDEEKVSAKCKEEPSGFTIKATGELDD